MEETTTAVTAVKQEVQLRDWAAQIEAQQASGMTVQKWRSLITLFAISSHLTNGSPHFQMNVPTND